MLVSALPQKNNKNSVKKVNLLSRAEMRKVMGGVVPEEGGGDGDGPKVVACYKKKLNEACSWEYQGSPQTGKCLQFGVSVLHCSDLPE